MSHALSALIVLGWLALQPVVNAALAALNHRHTTTPEEGNR